MTYFTFFSYHLFFGSGIKHIDTYLSSDRKEIKLYYNDKHIPRSPRFDLRERSIDRVKNHWKVPYLPGYSKRNPDSAGAGLHPPKARASPFNIIAGAGVAKVTSNEQARRRKSRRKAHTRSKGYKSRALVVLIYEARKRAQTGRRRN